MDKVFALLIQITAVRLKHRSATVGIKLFLFKQDISSALILTPAWTVHRSAEHFNCVAAFTLDFRNVLQVVVVTSMHLK